MTVSNTGGTAVTFTNIVTSGDFAGATLAQCPSLAVEAEPCVFSITFKPTATGTRNGTITFTDNATGSPQTVTLTGTGTPGTATVTVTPSSLTFGSQALTTTSAPLSVTVTNTSTGTVNFTGFTVSGEDAGDFGVPLPNTSSGCSATGTLAAGGSCMISVVFTPQANGTRTATLNIADNATGSPQTVALSGTGVTSQVIIAVAPGGSTTATTVSGGTAYYGLVISGAPGVTGTVQLGCVPSSVLITCKVIPSIGDVDGWGNGSGVCDPDVLPGEYDGDGNCSANRRRKWRRDWMVAGFDGFWWRGMDVQAKPESGDDVWDIAASGVRVGGLQQ